MAATCPIRHPWGPAEPPNRTVPSLGFANLPRQCPKDPSRKQVGSRRGSKVSRTPRHTWTTTHLLCWPKALSDLALPVSSLSGSHPRPAPEVSGTPNSWSTQSLPCFSRFPWKLSSSLTSPRNLTGSAHPPVLLWLPMAPVSFTRYQGLLFLHPQTPGLRLPLFVNHSLSVYNLTAVCSVLCSHHL